MVWKPHATVAAIIERDNQFLMVEELVHNKRVYNQPAGHLDPNESLLDAVVRETREETAWLFEPEALVGIYLWNKDQDDDIDNNPNETFLRFAYCGQCSDFNQDQKLDEGIEAALWMSKKELEERFDKLRSPLVLRCIEDYLAGFRYPLDMTHVVR